MNSDRELFLFTSPLVGEVVAKQPEGGAKVSPTPPLRVDPPLKREGIQIRDFIPKTE